MWHTFKSVTYLLNIFFFLKLIHLLCFSRAGNATAKCVEKVCVSPEEESNGGSEHPEEYFEAAEDFFYISSDKLPWSQAQTECLTKKGHLAELGGKIILCHQE